MSIDFIIFNFHSLTDFVTETVHKANTAKRLQVLPVLGNDVATEKSPPITFDEE